MACTDNAEIPLVIATDRGLDGIRPSDWDALVGEGNPFLDHAFLRALETSGSVGTEASGWLPRFVTAWRGERLAGALPSYVRLDSYGEYIFDWAWAQAAQAAGLDYYPKITVAVPFTPATGSRVLLAPGENLGTTGRSLLRGLAGVADEVQASSVHVLFHDEREAEALVAEGYLQRASCQFHWLNDGGWNTFADYLAAMRSRVRKQVRRERRQAQSHGLTLSVREGAECSERDWQALWEFYRDTTGRKWGSAYLTHAFFASLRDQLADRVVAAFAHDGDEPLAGALFFRKGSSLFGRYWGCRVPLPAMHFELCYYQAIEYCLANGLTRFEAGAQGEHKLKRGLLPQVCHSAHWIRHPDLRRAVASFLPREAAAVRQTVELYGDHSPFRCDASELSPTLS